MRTWTLTALAAFALVLAPTSHAGRQRAADCRPARVIVYAQQEWPRLAAGLAAHASPCADYYISVPPVTNDKTTPRLGQAKLIHAYGPNFHALAEIHWTTWVNWVTQNNANYAQAGITARQLLEASDFNIGSGDTWAVNEVPSSVRKNTGATRQNFRDFIRGLAEGDGSKPVLKGVVFVIGVGQNGPDLGTYKSNLQAWAQDSAFWTDMSAYVSDWAQESYGDVRAYAAVNTTAQQRRDSLEQFLGAPLNLIRSAPPGTGDAAQAFLNSAYVSLGNAAWAWQSSYGWTAVDYTLMQDYVSAQTYAQRALSSSTGASVDRIGYAWVPQNVQQYSRQDFLTESNAVLERLSAAIADSGSAWDPTDPGAAACTPPGGAPGCTAVLSGATLSANWAQFSTWSSSAVAISTPPAALLAGVGSGPLTLQYRTGTAPATALTAQTVNLTSSSVKGQFSISPTGPWTPLLPVTIPAGSSTATFYYLDTMAGSPTISATQPGQIAATQTETVAAAAPAAVTVAPSTATVDVKTPAATFTATATDAYGNSVVSPAVWSLAPAPLGKLVPATSGGVTVGWLGAGGQGTLTAQIGGVGGSATVTFVPPPATIDLVKKEILKGRLVVTARVVQLGKPKLRAVVDLVIRRGSSVVGRFYGVTGAKGQVVWRSHAKLPKKHRRAWVYTVTATLAAQPPRLPASGTSRGGR